MEVNSLKLHGKGQFFGMLRLALIPAIAGTRAPLSMTRLKHVGKLRGLFLNLKIRVIRVHLW